MEILPIDAIVYNQNKVRINDCLAPPYDVIDADYRQELLSRNEYNIVNLILPVGDDCYKNAGKIFDSWKEEKILINTQKPSIFYLVQKYRNQKGALIERKGFIARNKIEEFDSKKILPHEYTMGGPKEDRFNLLCATGAFFSQIFMVYDDKTKKIENEVYEKYKGKKPFIDAFDDSGTQHSVYLIDDEDDIKIIQETLLDKTLLIADGHHRYETSMKYAKEHKENKSAQYVMSYYTNAQDENLIIYPTHRIIEKEISPYDLLKKVAKYYNIEIAATKEDFLNRIEQENKNQITTGLVLKDDERFYILKLKNGVKETIEAQKELQNLDLVVLHEIILKKELKYTDSELMSQEGIKYEKKEKVAFDSVKENKACACFIMAYPKMDDILNVSRAGLRMPQKSTYFYPKLLSGLVINPIEKVDND